MSYYPSGQMPQYSGYDYGYGYQHAAYFPAPQSAGYHRPPPQMQNVLGIPDYCSSRQAARRRLVIADVPNEIWELIFRECISSLSELEQSPLLSWTPMYLSQINRRLRHMVQRTPKLWTTLGLFPNPSGNVPSDSLVKNWLRLAGNRRLSIAIGSGYRTRGYMDRERAYKLFNRVLREIHRWREISLDVDWTVKEKASLPALPEKLRAMTIYRPNTFMQTTPFVETLLQGARPYVQNVGYKVLGGMANSYCAMHEIMSSFMRSHCRNVASSQLTELIIDTPIFVDEALGVLMRTPHLKQLQLGDIMRIDAENATVWPNYRPPVLPHNKYSIALRYLHTLKIAGSAAPQGGDTESRGVMATLLGHLLTPALQNATFRTLNLWDYRALVEWYKHSRIRLTSLSLEDVVMHEKGLHVFLHTCRTVRYFHFGAASWNWNSAPLGRDVIDWMWPMKNADDQLLPYLETISTDRPGLRASRGKFAKMVRDRCEHQTRYLRSVHVDLRYSSAGKPEGRQPGGRDHRRLQKYAKACKLRYTFKEDPERAAARAAREADPWNMDFSSGSEASASGDSDSDEDD